MSKARAIRRVTPRLVERGVTFRPEPKQLKRLDAVAQLERRSRSFVMRDALDEFLARYEREHEKP